jgi:hypothetical protein
LGAVQNFGGLHTNGTATAATAGEMDYNLLKA